MRIIASILAVTACLAMAVPAFAGGGCGAACGDPCIGTPSCCGVCGCQAKCRKVCCQIICDYKEVEKKVWCCKCEDYCLPVPCLGGCCNSCDSGCGTGCGGCDVDCESSCSKSCGSIFGKWCLPVTCGIPRVKKKLMLQTIKYKVPVYKCETRYLCGGCEAAADVVAPEKGAPAPKATPAPAPKAAPLPPAPKQAAMPLLPRF